MRRIGLMLLCLCIVSIAYSQTNQGLPSQWQLLQTTADLTPETLPDDNSPDWKSVSVPEYVGLWEGQKTLWYKCKFSVEKLDSPDKHRFLCFDSIKFSAVIWIDNHKVGEYSGGGEPFELDITPLTESGGEYTLLVRVEGYESICKPCATPEITPDWGGLRDTIKDRILWPIGSQGFNKIGIWEPVRLEIRDTIYIDDLFIQTSVEKKTITVSTTIKNLTSKPQSIRVKMAIVPDQTSRKFAILENNSVPIIPDQKVTIPANASQSFTIAKKWDTPCLWSPRVPFLYNLNCVCLSEENDEENGAANNGNSFIERINKAARFGFREFRCVGDLFYLNGVPMHALGTSKHPDKSIQTELNREKAWEMYRSIRIANCNFMRLHANLWPRHWVEVADEAGMPLILESAAFCYARSYALTDPQFWTNYQVHICALQKKFRNNPSFCILSMENELLHCGGKYCNPDCQSLLAKAGIKAQQYDGTRPVMFEADMDPSVKSEENPNDQSGIADIINIHYPLDFAGNSASHEDTNWPDVGWWMESGKVLASEPKTFWKWNHKKPLYIGEFLHLQGYQTADSYSLILGERAYQLSQQDAMAQTKARTWAMQIPAYRAAGVTGLCPWVITEPGVAPIVEGKPNPRYKAAKDAYQPVTVIVRPVNYSCWAGEKKSLDLFLINDTDSTRQLNLTVTAKNPADSDGIKFNLPPQNYTVVLKPAERKSITVDLDFSKIELDQKGAACIICTVDLELTHKIVPDNNSESTRSYSGGLLAPGEDSYFVESGKVNRTFDLEISRKFNPIQSLPRPSSSKIGYIGLQSDYLKAISSENIPVEIVPSLENLDNIGLLVIGENQLQNLIGEQKEFNVHKQNNTVDKVSAFIQRGGTVLVLHQDTYPLNWLPIKLSDLTLSCPDNNPYTKYWSCNKPFVRPAAGPFFNPNSSLLTFSGLYNKQQSFHFAPIDKTKVYVDSEGRNQNDVKKKNSRSHSINSLGSPQGQEYCHTIQAAIGKGVLILTQLSLDSSDSNNPAASQEFIRSIKKNVNPPRSVFVLDSTGTIQKLLCKIGAVYQNYNPQTVKSSDDSRCIVLINADSQVDKSWFRQDNIQYYLFNLTPDNLSKWGRWLPEELSLSRNYESIVLTPSSDCIWYAPRGKVHYSTPTPIQNNADWLIVPFAVDKNRVGQYPTISCGEFNSNNDKASIKNDVFYSFTNVDLLKQCTVSPGNYFLELNAHGSTALGESTRVKILLDDKSVACVDLDNDFSNKRIPIYISKSPFKLTIRYDNDKWDPVTGQDRNLWFRSVRFLPTRSILKSGGSTEGIFMKIDDNLFTTNLKVFNPDYPTIKPNRLIQQFLAQSGVEFESPLGKLRIPGASFQLHAKLGRLDSDRQATAHLGSNGSIKQIVNFGSSSEYTFILSASGTAVNGIYPHLNLLIDGRLLGEFQLVDSEINRIACKAEVSQGTHTVELQFDNDAYITVSESNKIEQDRNVKIIQLEIE